MCTSLDTLLETSISVRVQDCTARMCASNASLRLYHIEWLISTAGILLYILL